METAQLGPSHDLADRHEQERAAQTEAFQKERESYAREFDVAKWLAQKGWQQSAALGQAKKLSR